VTLAGLVLAAGGGRRFGGAKALVDFDGERLVDRAVRVLRTAGCEPVLVVLGAQAAEVCRSAQLAEAIVVVNDGWERGMGSSLGCGLRALADLGATAVAISLVDQPGLTSDAVRRVAAAASEGRPARATYEGRPGHPVVLPATVWSDVTAAATGDEGARAWFTAHAEEVVQVACDDLGNDLDIDTVADLARSIGGAPGKDAE
jgi:CTP:molybdopterin cytidylyltransferase MocA